jgi:Lon protease-like protein
MIRPAVRREDHMNDDDWLLANFSGTARLFPLPNLVLFPQVVQPLHVFEPRYRELTADTLAGDQLMAMALLQPGWEEDYDGRPALHSVACLGRVIGQKKLTDGRYVILLRGMSRIRIVDELPSSKLYRTASTVLLPDTNLPSLEEAQKLRRRLTELVLPRFAGPDNEKSQLRELLAGEMPLGPVCDHLCYRLPLPVEHKQRFLEEPNVALRAERLLEILDGMPAPDATATAERRFPPDFSTN